MFNLGPASLKRALFFCESDQFLILLTLCQ